jgi:hypothetical protein
MMDNGFEEIVHETRAGCVKAFKEAKEKYINSRTTSKKVILYKFKMSGFIQGPAKFHDNFIPGEDDPEETICLFRGEDFSFDKGMIVGVKARIYIQERNEREDGEVYWIYNKVDDADDLPQGLRDDCRPKGRYGDQATNQNRIDWTPERHAFFVSLYEAMSQLILKIKHLADPEQLEIAMKSKRPLLIDAGSPSGPEIGPEIPGLKRK